MGNAEAQVSGCVFKYLFSCFNLFECQVCFIASICYEFDAWRASDLRPNMMNEKDRESGTIGREADQIASQSSTPLLYCIMNHNHPKCRHMQRIVLALAQFTDNSLVIKHDTENLSP